MALFHVYPPEKEESYWPPNRSRARFEMLDWNEMKDTYELLTEQIKEAIKNKGLAPNI
jgi:hypothetical protein